VSQFVMGAEDGSIYLVTTDGDLLWYGDGRGDGTAGWRINSGNRIGLGWQTMRLVFGGPEGVLYGVDHAGDLFWYKDAHRDGTSGWAEGSGQKIGNGWGDVRLAFAAPGGIIYAIHNDGDLSWFKDAHRNGTPGWAAGSGGRIGNGWNDIRLAFASTDGIIYGINNNGNLHWYRDAHGDGTPGWAPNTSNTIGSGWQTVPHAFAGAPGVIYGVDVQGLLRWYRDVPRNGTPGWAERSGDMIGSGWIGAEWNPTLRDFGHGGMTIDGRPALGPRPLVVLLAEYTDNAAGDFPAFSSVHASDYYQKIAFGTPAPPFSTNAPVNPASLGAYFRECSQARFWLAPGAVIGPLAMGALTSDPGPEVRAQRIIQAAAQLDPGRFFSADADGNSFVTASEMVVLIVENVRGLQPANRVNSPVTFKMQLAPFLSIEKQVQVRVAFAGPFTPFYQIAHEVSHCLGTEDMYNAGLGNTLITLMGGYSFTSNDQVIVHLDAWHKLKLGWCEPRRRRVTRSGNEALPPAAAGNPSAPLILWHPQRGASEFFMLEWRAPLAFGVNYESGIPGDGVLLWHVTPGAPTQATHLGAPNLANGGNAFWGAGVSTPPLTWMDGTPVGISLSFEESLSQPPLMRVRW
jgi:M6 family metalloprotease-like protein